MARIPIATHETMPEDQRAVYDAFAEGRGGVPPTSPFALLCHIPEMARRLEDLRQYLRNEPSLAQDLQELAMLITARENDCLYIWNAHAAAARRAGLRDDIVDNLRDKKELTDLTPEQSLVVNLAREFFRTRKVSQETFEAGMSLLGLRGFMTLVNLMGTYAVLAINMNTWDLELPPGATERPLPV